MTSMGVANRVFLYSRFWHVALGGELGCWASGDIVLLLDDASLADTLTDMSDMREGGRLSEPEDSAFWTSGFRVRGGEPENNFFLLLSKLSISFNYEFIAYLE
jgi:hypothetical protein